MDAELDRMLNSEEFDGRFSKEQIEFITDYVTRTAKESLGARLREVILYGSYARGDYHDWSDVDIMLVVEGTTQEVEHKISDGIREALFPLGYRMNFLLSVLTKSAQDFEYWKEAMPFLRNVDTEGVRVYVA